MSEAGETGAGAGARVLLVVAHPALDRSRANRAMLAAAGAVAGVEVHDLYEAYPDYLIDVEAEQARLAAFPAVVLQFPLYWYSTPALLKEWLDQVWLYGFAYGRGGDALAGKALLVACSAGSPEADYGPAGSHGHPLESFLRPLEQTAALCRMRWEAPFVVHESRLRDDASLIEETQRYRGQIAALAAGPPN